MKTLIVAVIVMFASLCVAQDQKPLTPEQQVIYNILMPHQELSPEARTLFDPTYVPPVKKDGKIVRVYKAYDNQLAMDYAQRYCAINKPTAKHPRVQRVYLKHGDIYNCSDKSVTLAGAK